MDEMKLVRYGLSYTEGTADPLDATSMEPAINGEYVKFSDVVALIHNVVLTIQGFDAAANSPRNTLFHEYPVEVWGAVVDRDFANAENFINEFSKDIF